MKHGHLISLLVTILTLLFVSSNGMGESPRDVHDDLVRPNSDEFTGNLDSINLQNTDGTKATVVINDAVYSVDPKAIFRAQGGGLTTLASFKPGMTVKFFAIDSLLTKMWPVAEPQATDSQADSGGNKSSSGMKEAKPEKKIRKENGVWKN